MKSARPVGLPRYVGTSLTLLVTLSLSACASTSWQDTGTYYSTHQKKVAIVSQPTSRVYIDNNVAGTTPLTTYFECEEAVRKKTRSVTYWQSQPGLAVLITIVSLGIYLPFSAIPVETETALEPTGNYKKANYDIRLEADGYVDLRKSVPCGGSTDVDLNAALSKKLSAR